MELAATMNYSEMDKNYQSFMKNSLARAEAAKMVIQDIEKLSGRAFSIEDAAKIIDVITWCDIEDGVTVFMSSDAPKDKRFIGKVELPTEHVLFYFGKNRAAGARFPYALGVCFRFKQNHELLQMNLEYVKREYPAFAKPIQDVVTPGTEYQLKVYPKAAEFYSAVRHLKGEWLIQVPSSKGQFVPNRGIGLKEKNSNVIHIFEPHPRVKASRKYAKRVCFSF